MEKTYTNYSQFIFTKLKAFAEDYSSIIEELQNIKYELENALREKFFLRVSKSLLLNLMKVKAIKPAVNGRFVAILQSGEEIMISRKYVPELKKALKGGVD